MSKRRKAPTRAPLRRPHQHPVPTTPDEGAQVGAAMADELGDLVRSWQKTLARWEAAGVSTVPLRVSFAKQLRALALDLEGPALAELDQLGVSFGDLSE